jgi:hypothetical protein|tara:strand:- start:5329 stop:5484 length:156 start_codon:yes stop_codon:yes gene_type:complete
MKDLDSLDITTLVVCECKQEKKTITYRQIKNKWPICDCRKPMTIVSKEAQE